MQIDLDTAAARIADKRARRTRAKVRTCSRYAARRAKVASARLFLAVAFGDAPLQAFAL